MRFARCAFVRVRLENSGGQRTLAPSGAEFVWGLLAACALACGMESSPDIASEVDPKQPERVLLMAKNPGRILLIGIDGASLRVIEPLLAQGKLPHLARLKREGFGGRLRSHLPIESPRIWASIATGKTPEKHGIRGFVRKGTDGKRRLYTSSDRHAHALWNIVSDAGLQVSVVNWWNTHPLEKIRGVMVSDHLLPLEVLGVSVLAGLDVPKITAIVHPVEWRERVLALRDARHPLTEFESPFADSRLFGNAGAKRLSSHFHNDEAVVRIALEIEAELRPDLAMVFLPGIDRVSHVLWGSLDPPSVPDATPLQNALRAKRAAALRRYYEFTDALIGLLVAAYGPDDLTVVVSDHGFEPSRGEGHISGGHASEAALDGVVFAGGPRIVSTPSAGRPPSVNDITPTLLAWKGLAVAKDMDGRPAPFLEVETLEWIASYDGSLIERVGSGPSGAETAIVEQLEALGYLKTHRND